jgi:long-chain acyl-CoA synthetase
MATDEVVLEREAIDRAVEGITVGHTLLRNAQHAADRPALSWKDGSGTWRTHTWARYRDLAAEAALGFRALGVEAHDFVAIMARNRPEHVIADMGVVHANATPVSIYNTLAPEQIAYIAGHCEAKVAVVEGRELMERWEKIKADLPALERVVLIEDAEQFADYDWVLSWDDLLAKGREALAAEGGREEFERLWRETTPDDPATLVYTSGTTGPPKGVIITHRNAVWTCASLDRTGAYPTGLRAISYLPLAHSLERLATHYLSIYKAAHVYFCPEVLQVFEYCPEVRPQAFAGVPRLWEKLESGIMAKVREEPNERRRKIALQALETGRKAASLEQSGQKVPPGLKAKRALFDRLVFSKIRTQIGLDECRLAVSGAAPISRATLEFFFGIGIPIAEGYGMTECSAPSNINREGAIKLGTVGPALPGCEVKLAEDGEVLIRGGNVSPGYYKDDEKTAETFDADGWLHTGDIGEIDAEGFLKIVDRKKELIITAGGKNISPANLEALLKRHPLVGQACVIGDGRKYVAALIVLDAEEAEAWAKQNGLAFGGVAGFAREPRVVQEVQAAVDDANQHVSQVESVKRFTILPTEWTVDSEELTPTLKLKRRVIHEKYAAEIDELYASSGRSDTTASTR